MSPLFMNDLHTDLSNSMDGLSTIHREAELAGMESLKADSIFNMFLLLYADDTVILSETPAGLQKGLDSMDAYCKLWNLKLNAKKCKVVIFSKGKIRKKPTFTLNEQSIEIVDNYNYLGIKLH